MKELVTQLPEAYQPYSPLNVHRYMTDLFEFLSSKEVRCFVENHPNDIACDGWANEPLMDGGWGDWWDWAGEEGRWKDVVGVYIGEGEFYDSPHTSIIYN